MVEEEDDHSSLLSLKDFEERGIKIDPHCTRLEALVVVAGLASEKLEEENMRKEKKEKERESVESNGYLSRLAACNDFEYGSSSRSCNDRRTSQLASLIGMKETCLWKNMSDSLPKLYIKEKQGVDADFDNDKWTCLDRISDRRQREKTLKKPLTDLVSKKKPGFQKATTGKKLMGDAMKARILP